MECEFCGYEFPESCGRYGCPNCEGDGLADPEGDGWDEGRAEPGGIEGRPDASECCGAVADAECMQPEQHEGTCARPGETQGTGASGESAGCGGLLANTSSPRQQRPELGTARNDHRGGQEAYGSVSQLCGAHDIGLFAPGPADERWPGILASAPWLAPAIDKAAESLLHRAPDGLALGLDFGHRAARLKCCGNGVVSLQAAAAAVVLVRRMMEAA